MMGSRRQNVMLLNIDSVPISTVIKMRQGHVDIFLDLAV